MTQRKSIFRMFFAVALYDLWSNISSAHVGINDRRCQKILMFDWSGLNFGWNSACRVFYIPITAQLAWERTRKRAITTRRDFVRFASIKLASEQQSSSMKNRNGFSIKYFCIKNLITIDNG